MYFLYIKPLIFINEKIFFLEIYVQFMSNYSQGSEMLLDRPNPNAYFLLTFFSWFITFYLMDQSISIFSKFISINSMMVKH